ncbi:MAG: aminoacyl-tRNA hydrolase [Oscillospiraceae bacterium]|nr:aminoacyl-tRNA hydrolase [Oscillospiraceae bacterium]
MLFRRKNQPISWIIVFLGNPGKRYENTRHNAGFITADFLERNIGTKIDKIKYKSLTSTVTIGEQQVMLIKPQTYMNLSGSPAKQAMDYWKVPLTNLLVVSDDIAMPAGKLRIRRSGSAGGHNGLKDIIAKCGGDGFPRIKIGVGAPPNDDWEVYDWVLSTLSGEDEKTIKAAAVEAAAALEMIITQGIDQAMLKYN